MNNDAFEQWYKSTKNFSTPYSGLSKAIADIYQRSIQQHMQLISENLSRTSEQFKRLSEVRKPEDLFELQKEYISENSTATVENMQKMLRTMTENVEELTELYSSTCHGQTATTSTNTKHSKENVK